MKRIAACFARARAEKRKALVIYLTASDPDHETSRQVMVAAVRGGADILEIGVPWSDPSADGVAIQAAMHRALAAGGGLRKTLELCAQIRAEAPDVGIVLFGYSNPVFVLGPATFATSANAAGADAVLLVDWPPDEAQELTAELHKNDLDFITLLAPTSTPDRILRVTEAASGFIYYVSFTGITGAALTDLESPRRHVAEIRELTGDRLPIVVGFGIKTPNDVTNVAAFADGVVIGSAAVQVVQQAVAAGRDPATDIESYVRSLRAAV